MKLNNKGFTLVEVLAVIVIIAIIGGIAISGVLSAINTGKNASYKILVSNIVTASQSLYEEVEFGDDLYNYDISGKTNNKVIISGSTITINLQTLVSNGFLEGTVLENDKKVLLDPKTNEYIGDCIVKITKNNTNGKVNYTIVNNDGNSDCPSTSDYEKGVK